MAVEGGVIGEAWVRIRPLLNDFGPTVKRDVASSVASAETAAGTVALGGGAVEGAAGESAYEQALLRRQAAIERVSALESQATVVSGRLATAEAKLAAVQDTDAASADRVAAAQERVNVLRGQSAAVSGRLAAAQAAQIAANDRVAAATARTGEAQLAGAAVAGSAVDHVSHKTKSAYSAVQEAEANLTATRAKYGAESIQSQIATDRLSTAHGKLTKSMEFNESHLVRVSGRLHEMGHSVAYAQGGMLLGALAVEEFGKSTISAATDYESAQAKIQGATDETKAQVASLGKAFLAEASTGISTFTAGETAAAYGQVAGQLKLIEGHALSNAQALNVMKAAQADAEATGADLGSETSALTNTMQAFHIPLRAVNEESDQLFNISRSLNIPIASVSTSVDRLHSRLGIAAPTLKDTGSLMISLGKAGAQGSRSLYSATSALNSLLAGSQKAGGVTKATADQILQARIAAQTAADAVITAAHGKGGTSSEQYAIAVERQTIAQHKLNAVLKGTPATLTAAQTTVKALGLSVYDQHGKFVGMKSIIEQLHPVLGRMNQAQREVALTTLFGRTSAQLMGKVIQGGVKDWENSTKAADKHGSAEKAAAEQAKTLKGASDRLHATFNAIEIEIGDHLVPTLAKSFGWLAKHKTITETLAGVIGGVLVLSIVKYVAELVWASGRAVFHIGEQIAKWTVLRDKAGEAGDRIKVANQDIVSSTNTTADQVAAANTRTAESNAATTASVESDAASQSLAAERVGAAATVEAGEVETANEQIIASSIAAEEAVTSGAAAQSLALGNSGLVGSFRSAEMEASSALPAMASSTEMSMGRMSGAIAGVVGVIGAGGIGASTAGTTGAVEGTLMGAVSGAVLGLSLGGPFGAAIGAAGGALVGLAGHFLGAGKGASQAAKDIGAFNTSLSTGYQSDQGKLGDQSRAAINQFLKSPSQTAAGIPDLLANAGVTMNEIIKGIREPRSLKSAVAQVNRAYSEGKLTGDDFNKLLDALQTIDSQFEGMVTTSDDIAQINGQVTQHMKDVGANLRSILSIPLQRIPTTGITSHAGEGVAGLLNPVVPPQVTRHRAVGGEVIAGTPYQVGERGPETVVFGASGRVYPHGETARSGSRSGDSYDQATHMYLNRMAGGIDRLNRTVADGNQQTVRAIRSATGVSARFASPELASIR